MLRRLLAAAVILVTAACSTDGPESEPTATSTPLSALDTAAIAVVRGELCSRVAADAVDTALGGPAETTEDYGNGDTADLAPGVTDVAHEYGCTWAAADGTTARAWVFAPPVSAGQANRLRDAAVREKGCATVGDAARFGTRTVAVRCAGGTTTLAGLFGDAWLSCSLRLPDPPPDATARTETWCADVLRAAAATP